MFVSDGFAGQVHVQNLCPSEFGGKLIAFYAEGCNALPCTFVRGRSYNAELIFEPGRNSTTLSIRCGAVVLGEPQIIADWSACEDLTKENRCPVKAGETYKYAKLVEISPFAPPGMYTVHCELVDDKKTQQLCVQGDVRLLPW
ncbi:unnamed protein product [Allacma fusca]|uniref:MD-2-related lipid-recognition domain-containing protein n=1 Tax=Allacma fusca TaxID=39272 RepID=A0A8J2LAF0_9HEXA|nr:unnamed protein product [Allacma fusca]